MATQENQPRYLRRKDASEYITSLGIPMKPATLARKACVGGGPPFRLFGRIPVYEAPDLDVWIEEQLSGLIRSTSELKSVSA